jgi:hypothetical protein
MNTLDIFYINDLRSQWRTRIENDGGYCPVCDRWGKISGFSINATMAKSLIWLCTFHHDTANTWVNVPLHAPRWLVRSNQLPTLRRWGLVERCAPDEEGQTKYSGLWRPTSKGWAFFQGKISIPKKFYAYNNKVEGYSIEQVKIMDCFKTNFDYQQVMSGIFSADVAEGKVSV